MSNRTFAMNAISICLARSVTYYGETERHLKVRAGWHKSMSALTGKGSIKAKNLPLKITAFFQVTCVPLMV